MRGKSLTRSVGLAMMTSATLFLCGCGNSKSTGDEGKTPRIPTASINPVGKNESQTKRDVNAKKAEKSQADAARQGLEQIKLVRLEAPPKTTDLAKMREFRRKRNTKIIELAKGVIRLTHNDQKHAAPFAQAVRELMQAQYQLALLGKKDDIERLYADAELITRKYPKSQAAAEAQYAVARFAFDSARRYGHRDAQWITEFAKRARMFASDYPQPAERATQLLFSAAKSAEMHDRLDDAKACYAMLAEKFPKTDPGKQSVAIYRRLMLIGKVPKIGGPTQDGAYLRIEDYRGKPVVVVFWSSKATRFVKQAADMNQLLKSAGNRVHTIGVNLDRTEPELEAFLDKQKWTWPQIFMADAKQRGWDSPLVKYYGIHDIPLFWVLDKNGKVVAMTKSARGVVPPLRTLLSR